MKEKTVVIENKIAEFRKHLGLSQHRLAKKVGLTRWTIMSYENQQSYPTLDMAIKISEILKKDITDVFFISNKNIKKNK